MLFLFLIVLQLPGRVNTSIVATLSYKFDSSRYLEHFPGRHAWFEAVTEIVRPGLNVLGESRAMLATEREGGPAPLLLPGQEPRPVRENDLETTFQGACAWSLRNSRTSHARSGL